MVILGLNAYHADASVALVKDVEPALIPDAIMLHGTPFIQVNETHLSPHRPSVSMVNARSMVNRSMRCSIRRWSVRRVSRFMLCLP